MWLLVGLGNPGTRYAKTRHNIGFMVLDKLAENLGLTFKEKNDYRICSGSISGLKVKLIEPLTFMNLSGRAVHAVAWKNSVEPSNIIVVHDDLDLDVGRTRIRKTGSSGGHKGIDSIIQCIGSRDFIRIKIGIGRDPFIPTEKYVLSRFTREEMTPIREAIDTAVDSLLCIIGEGIDKAMNRFN